MAIVGGKRDELIRANRKREMLALLAGIVVLLTAFVLMVPALSLTNDQAREQDGFYLDNQAQVASTSAASADGEDESSDASSKTSDGVQAEDKAASDDSADAGEASEGDGEGADEGAASQAGDSASEAAADGARSGDGDATAAQAEQASAPAQSFEHEVLNKKGDVTLFVAVDAPEGALPAGTTMKVESVKASKVEGAVEDAVADKLAERDSVAKDEGKAGVKVDGIQAVDITFVDADGNEIQPAKKVAVKFASPRIAEAEAQPLVVHVDDEGRGDVVKTLSDKQLAKRDVELADDELMVDARDFSVYAVVYTVDFEYEADGGEGDETGESSGGAEGGDASSGAANDRASTATYRYSLAGGGSMMLSELFDVLRVNASLEDVESVEFSDPSLLNVRRLVTNDGPDWVLKSLKPFTSTEKLTVALKNGSTIVVKVTDAQEGYQDMNAAGTVEGSVSSEEGAAATYNKDTQRYKTTVDLDFTIYTATIQEHKKFDLTLGENVIIPADVGREFEAYDSVTGHVSFTYKFVYNQSDGRYHMLVEYQDDYLEEIAESGRTIGKNSLTVDIEVTKEATQQNNDVKFNLTEGVELTIPGSEIAFPKNATANSDISVSKSYGSYDKTANTLTYTLTVSSTAGTDGKAVAISDVLNVNGSVEVGVTSIAVSSITKKTSGQADEGLDPATYATTTDVGNKTVTFSNLPALPANSSYEITYVYTLADAIASSSDFEASGSNSVTATSDSIEDTTSNGWNISKQGIGLGKSGSYSSVTGMATWTISLTNNTSDKAPVTDAAFAGLSLSDLTITDNSGNPVTGAMLDGDTLTIPAGVSGCTITYTTAATSPDPTKDSSVKNTVTVGTKTAEASVSIPKEANVSKKFMAAKDTGTANVKELTWRVAIDVPKSGFAAGTKFTESMGFNLWSPWTDLSDKTYFTEEQYTAYVKQLKGIFGDALTDEDISYTPAAKGEYNVNGPTIVAILNKDWDGGTYAGGKITFDYKTTVDTTGIGSLENTLTNEFKLNDTPAQATWSSKQKVTKKSEAGNPADVTTTEVTRDNNKLHWYIQVSLDQDTDSITVTDALPAGVKRVTEVAMGPGENKGANMTSLYSTDGGTTWIPASEWGHGVAPWQYTSMTAITPGAIVTKGESGAPQTLVITAAKNADADRPDYFKKDSNFYFYVEVEVDDGYFPAHGSAAEAVDYTNTASVKLGTKDYGSDDQTQQVTFTTDVISKGGSTNNWNGNNGLHEIAYTVDINPTGGHMLVDDSGQPLSAEAAAQLNDGKGIMLTDVVEYQKQVTKGSTTYDVSLNLKSGSAKLQKYEGGSWIDIPLTDGWGYTLEESSGAAGSTTKKKTITLYGIPDDTVLRFTYIYSVEVKGVPQGESLNIGDVKNTATIKGNFEASDSTTVNKEWTNVRNSASTQSTGSLTLVKVQTGNYAILLPDTYYVLEKYVPNPDGSGNNGTWEVIDPIGSNIVTIPDTNPAQQGYKPNSKTAALTISADPEQLGTDGYFAKDQLYRIREYRAQEGYGFTEDNPPCGYFFFADQEDATVAGVNDEAYPIASHADNLLFEADTVYLQNTHLDNSISATKQWAGSATNGWPETIDSITLKLLHADGSEVAAPSYYTENQNEKLSEWADGERVMNSSMSGVSWNYLDLVNGNYADYKVVETKITATYNGRTAKLTRSPEGTSALEDGSVEWYDPQGNLVYKTYGGSLKGTSTIITNTRNAKPIDLNVEKKWAATDPNGDDATVTFTLVAREKKLTQNGQAVEEDWGAYSEVLDDDGEPMTVALNKTAGWNSKFENLERYRYDEANGAFYEIDYSVEERVVLADGTDATDLYAPSVVKGSITKDKQTGDYSQDLTLTNGQNAGDLKVYKKWQDKDGNPDTPEGISKVTINLQRYILDADGTTKHYDEHFNRTHRDIDLTADDKIGDTTWAMLFQNLAITGSVEDGGQEYKGTFVYNVVEDTVTGYVTGYTGNDVQLVFNENGADMAKEVTVKNVEHYYNHTSDPITVQVKKTWDSGVANIDQATSTFRLYRYVLTETSYEDPTAEKTTVTVKIGDKQETKTLPIGSEVYLVATFEADQDNPYATFKIGDSDETITIQGSKSYQSKMVTSAEKVTVTKDLVIECMASSGLKAAEGSSEGGQQSLGVNVQNATLVRTDAMPDTEFNDASNDEAWTVTVTGNGTVAWPQVPARDVYVEDGETRMFVYGYYAVETDADAHDGRTYLPVYEGVGSEQNRVYNVSNTIPIKNEPGDSLKIRKQWYRLIDDYMPPVVVQLSYQERQNDNQSGTVVTSNEIVLHKQASQYDANSSGTEVDRSVPFTIITEKGSRLNVEEFTTQDGTKAYGIRLSEETGWNIDVVGLPEGVKNYYVTELGYLDGDVLKTLATGNEGFDNRHYYFSADGSEPGQTDHAGIFNFVKADNWTNGHNTGTMWVYNIPTYIGYQPELKKYWYGFDGTNGMQNLANGYNPDGLGYKVWTQQRATWVHDGEGHSAGELVHDWEDYLDELTIYRDSHAGGSEYEFIQDHAGGDAWLTTFNEFNFSKYGYELNPVNGKYELVQYDYQFRETGTVVGADGRTWSKWSQGYAGSGSHRYNMMNFETGPLEIKKIWDLTDASNKADKVFFTVKANGDSRMSDVAKRIYEEKDYSYYGLTADNVTYLKELNEYVIVLSGDMSAQEWDLVIKSLDLLDVDVDDAGNVTVNGEVTYNVEEVAIEKDGKIIAVTDNTFPYTATYYRNIREQGENLVGNTAENTSGSRLVADGLQLNSESTWNDTTKVKDNQPTYVKVVNSDKPVTSYTVTKAWPGDVLPTDSTRIVLQLQQRLQKTDANGTPLYENDGVTPQWDSEWQAAEGTDHPTVTLPLEGQAGRKAWTFSWKGLPVYKETGNSGTANATVDYIWYRTVETSSPSWTSPRLATTDGAGATGTEGTNATAAGEWKDGTYQGQSAYVAPTTDGDAPTFNKNLTQTVRNDVDTTALTIKKQWLRDGAEIEWPAGAVVNYSVIQHAYLITWDKDGQHRGFEIDELKQDPYVEPGTTHKLQGVLTESKQEVTEKGLPKGGLYQTGSNPPKGLEADMCYSVEYEYEVVETAMLLGGQYQATSVTTTPAANGTATIVNNLTSIKVVKEWGDSYNHDADSVKVQLYSSSQRPEGAVPQEYINLQVEADNWVYDGNESSRAQAPETGSISFNVLSGDDVVDSGTVSGPNWTAWTANELPRYDADGQPISYTIEVTDVSGDVTSAEVASGSPASGEAATVHLTGKVEAPPATFTLGFNNIAWQLRDQWQDGASAPTGDGAYITVTLSGGSVNKSYTFDANNHWGNDITEELLVSDGNNPITYTVDMQPTGSQVYAIKDNNWSPKSFTGTADGLVTVEWRGVAEKQQSSGGGDETEDNITVTASVDHWVSWPSDGAAYYKNYDTTTPPASGKITVQVKSGWEGVLGTLELSAENGWQAIGTFNQKNFNGYANGERVGGAGTSCESPIVDASATYNNGVITVIGKYPESAASTQSLASTLSLAPGRRLMMAPLRVLAAAPVAPTTSNKTVTELDVATADTARDKTPADRTALGDEVTLDQDNSWTYEWTDLPVIDGDGERIYYYVRETSANVSDSTTKVSVSYAYENRNPDDARDGIEQITITNTTEREEPTSLDIIVRKKDANGGKVLDGATFTWVKVVSDGNSGWTEQGEAAEFKAGTHKIEGLTEGYYKITEAAAPTRYEGASEPAIIQVAKSGTSFKASVVSGSSEFYNVVTADGNTYLDVNNTFKTTEFSFTKKWKFGSNALDWQQSITVTLNAFTDTASQKPVLQDAPYTLKASGTNPEGWSVTESGQTGENGNKSYTFTITGLPATDDSGNTLYYYVTEASLGGFTTSYETADGQAKPTDSKATSGQVIVNAQNGGPELPVTGGFGTTAFPIIGMLLIVGSLMMLFLRRRAR